MAVNRVHRDSPGDARELGSTFARVLKHDAAAARLWVSTQPDVVELWVLTEVVDAEDERRLYRLVDTLYERFPEARFRLHLLNPSTYDEFDLGDLLPPDADEIILRAA
jgi:hypothetical protein